MNQKIKSDLASAEIKSLGAEMTSLLDNEGTQYLWQGDPTYWASQSPVLFPIVGSIRNNTATVGGNKTCHMNRHGVVRHMEFTLIDSTESSATFSVCSTPESKEQFPYDFEFQVKYSLNGKTLTTSYTVINKDKESMPYFVGAHPAFSCPLLEGEAFEDYVVEFDQKEYACCPRSINGLVDVEHRTLILNNEKVFPLDRSWFSYDAQIFDQLKSRSAKMYNPKTGRGVKLDFPGFDYLVVWSSKNGGNFVAVEPWTGLSTCNDEDDIFEHKRGVKFLAPNTSATHSFDTTLL
jgi:galactose mutarotase-like enzyme